VRTIHSKVSAVCIKRAHFDSKVWKREHTIRIGPHRHAVQATGARESICQKQRCSKSAQIVTNLTHCTYII
jgi:hypothetical protein